MHSLTPRYLSAQAFRQSLHSIAKATHADPGTASITHRLMMRPVAAGGGPAGRQSGPFGARRIARARSVTPEESCCTAATSPWRIARARSGLTAMPAALSAASTRAPCTLTTPIDGASDGAQPGAECSLQRARPCSQCLGRCRAARRSAGRAVHVGHGCERSLQETNDCH